MKAQKIWVLFLAMTLVVFGFGAMAQAGNSDTQTVTFEVEPINEISAIGDPGELVINAAISGSQPVSVTDASTTYDITTNETSKKITAKIDTDMPTGTTLTVALAAPSVGSSAGATELTVTDSDVVTGIGKVAESGKTITYTFSATVTAGVLTTDTRTVTFTLTDGGV